MSLMRCMGAYSGSPAGKDLTELAQVVLRLLLACFSLSNREVCREVEWGQLVFVPTYIVEMAQFASSCPLSTAYSAPPLHNILVQSPSLATSPMSYLSSLPPPHSVLQLWCNTAAAARQ